MGNFFKTYRMRVKRFGKDKRGIAALEFALLMPTVVLMFFSLVELSDSLTANRKVSMAASTLADLASREYTITYADAQGMFTAVNNILSPYGISNASFTLMSVVPDASNSNQPVIDWSLNQNMTEVYAPGTAYNDLPDANSTYSGVSLLADGQSLIIVEVSYPFTSSLSGYRNESFTFTKREIRWPRIKSQIPYCDASGTCSDG
jgi:Flp pilus assembly protein TadG